MNEHVVADAVRAAEAAEQSAREAARVPVVVEPAEVEAIVALLPERAAAGKLGAPDAGSFLVHAWNPHDRRAAALAAAVNDRLAVLGLQTVRVPGKHSAHNVDGDGAGGLVVRYADLAAAAQRHAEARVAWVASAKAAWVAVGGAHADVREVAGPSGRPAARFSTRAMAVGAEAPFRFEPLRMDQFREHREQEHVVEDCWGRPPADVAAEVERAVQPVRWSLAELELAWRALGGDAVLLSFGMFTDGGFRQCSVVEFRKGGGSVQRAIEDVRILTAEVLARAVLAEGAGLWEQPAEPVQRPDPIDPRLVAGAARDVHIGLGEPVRRDDFKYVPPPGPELKFGGEQWAEAGEIERLSEVRRPEPGATPPQAPQPYTRMDPVEALGAIHQQRQAAGEAAASKSAPAGAPAPDASPRPEDAPRGPGAPPKGGVGGRQRRGATLPP